MTGANILVYDDDTDVLLGRIVDLSTRGLRMLGSRPIPRERRLTVRMETRVGTVPLILPATGRWAEVNEASGMFDSGMEFDELDLELRQRVKALRDVAFTPEPSAS